MITTNTYISTESTPKKALKKLIRRKYYGEEKTIIGHVVSFHDKQQWFFRMEMKAYSEKRTNITIRKIDFEYHGIASNKIYDLTEKLGKLSSEYEAPESKPKIYTSDYATSFKHSKLSKEKILEINDFNLSSMEVHKYLSTIGIDLRYYSMSSSFSIVLEDLKHLVSSGKYVNLVVFDESRGLNINPLTLDGINIKKFEENFPKYVKIMRIKGNDFE